MHFNDSGLPESTNIRQKMNKTSDAKTGSKTDRKSMLKSMKIDPRWSPKGVQNQQTIDKNAIEKSMRQMMHNLCKKGHPQPLCRGA